MTEIDLVRLIDSFDRVVSAAAVHAPARLLQPVALIARQVRMRRAYAGTARLVGLAGGTGSGKSSLLNALAGREISTVGAFRPTTDKALAWVPATVAPRLERLWELVGLDEVVIHYEPHNVALIDLPDVDSVEGIHRDMVDELIPLLDLVVWVVDPEKYRDRVLHEGYVRKLTGHQRRFRFVLNQIDRLAAFEVQEIVRDMAGALREDGVADPVVWVTAADPPIGPPAGIEQLWSGINSTLAMLDEGQERTITEIERGLRQLEPLVAAVGLAEGWDKTRIDAARLFSIRRGDEAWRTIRAFVQDLAAKAPEIDEAIDLSELVGLVEGTATEIAKQLDGTLGRHLRDALRPRATTRALLTELSLDLASLGKAI